MLFSVFIIGLVANNAISSQEDLTNDNDQHLIVETAILQMYFGDYNSPYNAPNLKEFKWAMIRSVLEPFKNKGIVAFNQDAIDNLGSLTSIQEGLEDGTYTTIEQKVKLMSLVGIQKRNLTFCQEDDVLVLHKDCENVCANYKAALKKK